MLKQVEWYALAALISGLLILRQTLESSMALHMAVQLPLLAIAGGLLGKILLQRNPKRISFARRYRISLLLVALMTFSLWMLPRLLDAALHDPFYALMKWLSLPLAGLCLAWSWPHLSFVLRGVLHIEALATLLRLGWLYLIAPQRYCVSYGLDEQVLLGYFLLSYGAIYSLFMAGRVLFGGAPLTVATSLANKRRAGNSVT